MMEVDPKRSGVRASLKPWNDETVPDTDDFTMRSEPGTYIQDDKGNLVLACPGCGQLGGPQPGQRWREVKGSFADVTTLSLEPSILRHCCGWHGYLTDGVFNSV